MMESAYTSQSTVLAVASTSFDPAAEWREAEVLWVLRSCGCRMLQVTLVFLAFLQTGSYPGEMVGLQFRCRMRIGGIEAGVRE